jgi:hypothetical protein
MDRTARQATEILDTTAAPSRPRPGGTGRSGPSAIFTGASLRA